MGRDSLLRSTRVANGKSERRRKVMWEGLTLAVHEGCEWEE